MTTVHRPHLDDDALAALSLRHLTAVVRVDSASDERSDDIPSTPGQKVLGAQLAAFFERCGCEVHTDRFGTVIAALPGRGEGADGPALALLVHLDTARGTRAIEQLTIASSWDGAALAYTANPGLQVSVDNYPSLSIYRGHDVVHGPGDAPFGLDDKLGLAHMMTAAALLHAQPDVSHRPLYLVARPDEEIGRHEALADLATCLAERGVTSGYTLDGLDPYEVNVENFEASHARVQFPSHPVDTIPTSLVRVRLGGVNTHGATAHAEGHRAAVRFAAELTALLRERDVSAEPVDFVSDPERDCDGTLTLAVAGDVEDAVRAAVSEVVTPHLPRGASYAMEPDASATRMDGAIADVLAWVAEFAASEPGYPLWAEDSHGRQGYSHPFRIVRTGAGPALDIRLRDFDRSGLDAREAHVLKLAGPREVTITQQYVNMGPALAQQPGLVSLALAAGGEVGVASEIKPIRGGTGVDPLLDAGVFVANLGTGYFAPESEKELTSLQTMAGHAQWVFALVQLPG